MKTKQKGAVLIVSLLLLMIMTILGVASMSSTVLEEKMANNNRQKQVAFQSASAALREAELWLSTNITTVPQFEAQFTGAPAELYWARKPTPATGLRPVAINVSDSFAWVPGNSATPATALTLGAESSPRYMIEYVGRIGQPPLDYTKPDNREYAFRITAIGWGMDNTTTYVVQSSMRMQLI